MDSENPMKKRTLLICFDDQYALAAKVFLYNLVKVTPAKTRDNLSIIIGFHPGSLHETHINDLQVLSDKLALTVSFTPLETSMSDSEISEIEGHLPLSAWLRLVYLCESNEPFVYIDVDTLLLPGWEEIFTQLEVLIELGKPIMACRDMLELPSRYRPLNQGEVLSASADRYFNSGVLLLNPKEWINRKSFKEAIQIWGILNKQGCTWLDQDVLNYLFADDVIFLDQDFNFFANDPFMWEVSKRLSSVNPPKIVHFVGPKPWNQQGAWKQGFIDSLMDDTCERPYQLAHLKYHQIVHEYRVFRKLLPTPRTFNEKIIHRMKFDRNEKLKMFVDKLAVREFVEANVGIEILPELYLSTREPEGIAFQDLPREFALKASHGSGASILISDCASQNAELPVLPDDNRIWDRFIVSPNNFDAMRARALMQKWLSQNYWVSSGRMEWAYRDVEPHILCEEILLDKNTPLEPIKDYKFFMFDGKCQLISVNTKTEFDDPRKDLFDPEWNRLELRYGYPNSDSPPQRPDELQDMTNIAEVLSSDIDFVRVDFYITTKGIKFGELTTYPDAGREKFIPEEWDLKLGEKWKLNY
jgi:lipopolysaccharide biosynthesis glycosyltransferase